MTVSRGSRSQLTFCGSLPLRFMAVSAGTLKWIGHQLINFSWLPSPTGPARCTWMRPGWRRVRLYEPQCRRGLANSPIVRARQT